MIVSFVRSPHLISVFFYPSYHRHISFLRYFILLIITTSHFCVILSFLSSPHLITTSHFCVILSFLSSPHLIDTSHFRVILSFLSSPHLIAAGFDGGCQDRDTCGWTHSRVILQQVRERERACISHA